MPISYRSQPKVWTPITAGCTPEKRPAEPGKNIRTNRVWSVDDDAQFYELIANGMSPGDAAKRLGRTRNSNVGRFYRFRKSLGWQGR